MLQSGLDPGPVVGVGGGELERAGALPQRHHGYPGVAQVLQQLRLDPDVTHEHDGVGVAGLQHGRQRDGFGQPGVDVAQHDVVAVPHRLHHQRLDGLGEERVAEVADHRADEVGRGPLEPARQRVGAVAEPA
jgi:hypothetical protein